MPIKHAITLTVGLLGLLSVPSALIFSADAAPDLDTPGWLGVTWGTESNTALEKFKANGLKDCTPDMCNGDSYGYYIQNDEFGLDPLRVILSTDKANRFNQASIDDIEDNHAFTYELLKNKLSAKYGRPAEKITSLSRESVWVMPSTTIKLTHNDFTSSNQPSSTRLQYEARKAVAAL